MNYEPIIPEGIIRKIKEDRHSFTVDGIIDLLEDLNYRAKEDYRQELAKEKDRQIERAKEDKRQLELDATEIVNAMKF